MEERRGESSDTWMKSSGISKSADIVLNAEARRATKECDEMGIDPNWSIADRVARLQDIHQGSPLMFEERKRKASRQANLFRDHVDQVVKNIPSSIAEQQAATKFHNK